MAKTRKNKSAHMLALAYKTFKRGEAELAKDMFVLAAEEEGAPEAMGVDEMAKPNPDELKAKIAKAIQDGDMDLAKSCMADLENCMAEDAAPAPVVDEPAMAGDDMDSDDTSDLDDVEAADDAEEMNPMQLASLVKIARKIKAAGHSDLAEKLTAALAQ